MAARTDGLEGGHPRPVRLEDVVPGGAPVAPRLHLVPEARLGAEVSAQPEDPPRGGALGERRRGGQQREREEDGAHGPMLRERPDRAGRAPPLSLEGSTRDGQRDQPDMLSSR